MSTDLQPPSESRRAITAVVSGMLLGLLLALASRGRGPRRYPAK